MYLGSLKLIFGYAQYIRDIMMHVGEQGDKNLSIYIESPGVMSIPRCTHDIPHVLMVFATCIMVPPMYSWYLPDVLMNPPMYWTPPDVLMVSPRCAHGIPRYTLNTHYTGCVCWIYSPGQKCWDILIFQSKFEIFNSIHLDSSKQKTMTPPRPSAKVGFRESQVHLSGWPNIVLGGQGKKIRQGEIWRD